MLLTKMETDNRLDEKNLILATLKTLDRQLRQAAWERDQAEADVRHVATISPW